MPSTTTCTNTGTMHHHHYPGGASSNGSVVDTQQSLMLPPSPTLTNPDMILPYENERENSTPSPPFEPLLLPSPPDFRHIQGNGQPLHTQSTDREVDNHTPDNSEIGMAVSFPARQEKRPSPPRNIWALGGHRVGPPLSDIGEEDASSTSSWHEHNGYESPVLASSPVVESHWGQRTQIHGGGEDACDSWSDDSSSTVSAHSAKGQWDGFDGSNVEHSGDRHSSRSDHTISETQIRSQSAIDESRGEYGRRTDDGGWHGDRNLEHADLDRSEEEKSMGSIPEERGEGDEMDEISSAMLSNEAERILENAKKRLTFMGGNLSRARTSLRMSPSPSPSPVNTGFPLGAPQPVGGLYRSISQSDRRVQTGQAGSRLRQNRTLALSREANNNQAHARGASETHLPSTLESTLPALENKHVFRSMSAMGSTGSTLHFGDNEHSHSRDNSRASVHSRVQGSGFYQPQALDALKEDDVQQNFQSPQPPRYLPSRESTPEVHHAFGTSSSNEVPKISTTEEFNSVYPSASPPSRAHSQLHVRDLQDQMKGLKTKLSSLKVKTEEDSLRRRSLQSLRTPSPFTAAEQWYTGAVEYRDGGNALNANAGYGFSPQISQESFEGPVDEAIGDGQNSHENHDSTYSPSYPFEAADEQSVLGSHYEDAEENYSEDGSEIDRAALDEILAESSDSMSSPEESVVDEEFHETSTEAPEPTRHEDREDAFDYEHFFLHSALGNYYSRSKAARRESYGSTGSAETTRPSERPESFSSATSKNASNRLSRSHARNPSADSISTVATFATATEGRGSDDEEEYEDEINNALQWNGNGDHAYSTNQTWPIQNTYMSPIHLQPSPNIINGSRDDYADSESSTSSAAETETGISTPRAKRRSQDHDDIGLRTNRLTQILSPPSNGVDRARPTSSLVSDLVSSVSTASSPSRATTPGGSSSSQLNNDDTIALEQLFKSLGKVCLELQESLESDGSFNSNSRSVTVLRRRLTAARRVLDGELDP